MTLTAYLSRGDDALPPAAPVDDAMDLAIGCLGAVRVVLAHPTVDVFVLLGHRLFATVEPVPRAEPASYTVRLARYGEGGPRALERRLRQQRYVEVEEADDDE